jgi:hypothetical protein
LCLVGTESQPTLVAAGGRVRASKITPDKEREGFHELIDSGES